MSHHWKLELLKKELSQRAEVKGWVILQENVRRRERYFLQDQQQLVVDQDRDVHIQNIYVKLMVKHPDSHHRQGEISKKFFQSISLKDQLDQAIEAAQQTDHQAWELPSAITRPVPPLRTADPKMAEDVNQAIDAVTERMRHFFALPKQVHFNSAELFLSVHDYEQCFSNGFTYRFSQSRAYAEAAYSVIQQKKKETFSDEFLNMRWSVNLDDLDLEGLFQETTERASQMLDVQKPKTQKYSVIVNSEVLSKLFNGHLSQLSAANAYHQLPFIKVGTEFIPGASGGDLITLSLDPTLDFGADTTAVSSQGVFQEPLLLVSKNKVVATSTDQQYAQYLKQTTTTSRGNVVLEPGSRSYEELTREAPQVIEILQFSALFCDPNSGTFSSEIRLARLYDNAKKTVSYIKGGSLSGSVTENFTRVLFSNRRVKRAAFSAQDLHGEGYFGPEYALLNDVSIVG